MATSSLLASDLQLLRRCLYGHVNSWSSRDGWSNIRQETDTSGDDVMMLEQLVEHLRFHVLILPRPLLCFILQEFLRCSSAVVLLRSSTSIYARRPLPKKAGKIAHTRPGSVPVVLTCYTVRCLRNALIRARSTSEIEKMNKNSS